MEIDPNSLDPELRTARFYAIMSAALGALSLCAGIVPMCGVSISALGMLLGYLSLRIEQSKTARAGIWLSIFGAMITLVYFFIMVQVQK